MKKRFSDEPIINILPSCRGQYFCLRDMLGVIVLRCVKTITPI